MIRKTAILSIFSLILFSCTKLDEKFRGDLTSSQVGSGGSANTAALLKGVYNSMQTTFQDQGQAYALWEMTTDELIGPTRGPDWDDNGVWRVLHEHKWDGENIRMRDAFNNLNGSIYAATDLLRFSPSAQEAAEARFIRAFAMYMLLDGWNQVPYREPGENVLLPSKVRKGTEALDYVISEITAIMAALPTSPAGKANQNAAKVLLMKCYLNKGVYANRQAPTFAAADMNQVITLADQVINSGLYSFTANYFDNFAPTNTTIGTENIWTQQNDAGVSGSTGATVRSRWYSTMHYNQNPSGWNGFATLSDFYNKFEASDKRKGLPYNTAGGPPNPGNRINVGILTGQQYNLTTDVPYRTGAQSATDPLMIFTPAVKSIETGTNLEVTGYRPNKYPVDYPNTDGGNINNDYVYFRLSDVLLMKAEAILRGGTGTVAGPYGNTPLLLVNYIRLLPSRSASVLASVTLDVLLDERGRELYLEGWRRQDLIRFGKFLAPFQEKNYTSDPKYLLFAIPNQQLAVNPNLTPNPGY